MKRLGPGLLTLVLATAAVAPFARAADLPVAPAPAPAAFYRPAIYNWTGFYIGGHVGAGLLQDTYTQIPGAAAFSVGSPINVGPPGAVGGAQAGFNYEFAPWVVGVEGSWTDTGVSGSGTTATTTPGFFERATTNTSWIAAATGRVGYAADTLLLYVKGGGAWMKTKYTQDILTGGFTVGTQTLTDTRNGFTAGAGLEYGFVEGWSGKLEYDFYDFGTTNYAFVNTPVSIKSNMHVLTAGLNYRFNWGQ